MGTTTEAEAIVVEVQWNVQTEIVDHLAEVQVEILVVTISEGQVAANFQAQAEVLLLQEMVAVLAAAAVAAVLVEEDHHLADPHLADLHLVDPHLVDLHLADLHLVPVARPAIVLAIVAQVQRVVAEAKAALLQEEAAKTIFNGNGNSRSLFYHLKKLDDANKKYESE
jgi:hypothetical protein